MLIALAFFEGDAKNALFLLEWIAELGGCHNHDLVLVMDPGVHWGYATDALKLGEKSFHTVKSVFLEESVDGWIEGSNALFRQAALYAQSQSRPFLFLEPDAVPVRAGWADEIALDYMHAKVPFLGSVVTHETPKLPNPYLEGVAVYPADAIEIMLPHWKSGVSWTLATQPAVIGHAKNSPLFQHCWGMMRELPPTFVFKKASDSPIHECTLHQILPATVIYHRNKDGTLINLLRQRLYPDSDRFVVVLPFCDKDAGLMVEQLRWVAEMGGCKGDDALLAYDDQTAGHYVNDVRNMAACAYRNVWSYTYPAPRSGEVTMAAKHAFAHVAGFMQNQIQRPWLWMESDMTALRPGWCESLQMLYRQSHRPFFGSVIQDMGHINGTAIYPWETATWCPSIRGDHYDAFDTGMRDEQRTHGVFDASAYMQHAWVMADGKVQPHGHGEIPTFRTSADVKKNILPGALTFHRVKDTSLIQRLREMVKAQ